MLCTARAAAGVGLHPRPTPQIEANLREQTLSDAWNQLAEFVEVDRTQPLTNGWEMLIDRGEFRHFYLPFDAATADGKWTHVNVLYLTEPQSVGNVSGYALPQAPDPVAAVSVADLMAAIDGAGGVLALAPPGRVTGWPVPTSCRGCGFSHHAAAQGVRRPEWESQPAGRGRIGTGHRSSGDTELLARGVTVWRCRDVSVLVSRFAVRTCPKNR
ncbi:MAG: hypothetical protein HZY76_18900 [Anaerolineae bacterium]|nr:MAG: hypothetical protein HZY76_18900 [Anaerolineae bacterium]